MTDANFLQGNIGIMTFEPLAQDALNLLPRFAKAFEFTYTRFLDLRKAEAQARQAEQQASLDRVRALMRTATWTPSLVELGIVSRQLVEKNKELESENERKARELEEARRLQLAMLPDVIPELPYVDIALYMQTAN